MTTIKIATDFSEVPAGRYASDGDFTGERFREEFLRPALARGGAVTVDIDGAFGYGSSFLEEAFGGLVRKGYFTRDELKRRLRIQCADSAFKSYEAAIWRFIEQAKSEPEPAPPPLVAAAR